MPGRHFGWEAPARSDHNAVHADNVVQNQNLSQHPGLHLLHLGRIETSFACADVPAGCAGTTSNVSDLSVLFPPLSMPSDTAFGKEGQPLEQLSNYHDSPGCS